MKSRLKTLIPASSDALKQVRLVDRLHGLAGMAWAYAVLHYSGMTARAASIYFTPPEHLKVDKKGGPVSSGIIQKYLNGSHKPRTGPRGKNQVDLYGLVAQESYGAKANSWLSHPLWTIFQREVTDKYLQAFCTPRYMSIDIVENLFRTDFSDEDGPKLKRFEEFLYVCAFYRSFQKAKYPSTIFPLLKHLLPKACELEPIFRYVQAPFLELVEKHYFKTDQQVKEAWPKVVPPCVDPRFSGQSSDGYPCPLMGIGDAKHICVECDQRQLAELFIFDSSNQY